MDGNAQPKVFEVFTNARDIGDSAAREAYVTGVCGRDLQLREQVLTLLRADQQAGAFMMPRTPSGEPVAGQVVGRYTLLEPLGEGGFGTVWAAEQEEPLRRTVAVKVLKTGMDSRQILERFEREKRALAVMEHPGIAQVFDAGTTAAGRPYFVMELVRGVPVTEYCAQKGLDLRSRLHLFIEVCHAVHHAHQKGVIHRDLKPSNVLIMPQDSGAVPKVIDFGIAKAVRDESAANATLTAYGLVGTPAYMSPEQARGDSNAIDTRSDVYSLGVILYELVTGRPPYDTRTQPLPAALRVVCEAPPRRPSTIRRALRGDLETIVLKTLEKEPDQRYASVAALADDLERFVDARPILARPHSLSYQLRKAVVRHKLAFSFVGTVVLLVAALAIGMTVMSIRLKAQRDESRRAKDAETAKLWDSYRLQARATRLSSQTGQRFEALAAIARAASIRPSLELRNEAIAALALPDVQFERVISPDVPAYQVAFSDDLSLWAAASEHGDITVRQMNDDAVVAQMDGLGDRPSRILFSHQATYLAATYCQGGQVGKLVVWSIGKPEPIARIPDVRAWNFAFTRDDGRLITSHPEKRICIWKTPGLVLSAEFDVIAPDAGFAPSPDGRKLAVARNERPAFIDLWDISSGPSSGSLIRNFPCPAMPWLPAWSDDGLLLAAGCDDMSIRIWNVESGELLPPLHGSTNNGIIPMFVPGTSYVLSDAWDSVARLWSPPLGHARLEIPGINPLAVASDGRSFGFGHRYGLLPTTAIPAGILRLDAAEECRWLYDPWSSGTWEGEPHVSPDERLLATEGSEGLRLWALPGAKPIALLRIGHTRGSYFGPDSRWLITSGQRGVWRWPLARSDDLLKIGPPECLYEHPAAGRTCLSADGRVLVMRSGDQDRALVVYLDGSRPVGTFGPLARGVGFIVSPDGRQIMTCAADGATVWDTQAGEPIARVPQSTTHPWFQFSPDGEKLLSVLSREIAILDTRTWEVVCRHTWTDAQPRIPGTPEGVLAASGAFGIVRLIDPRTLDVVADVPAPTPTSWARFVPRQRWLPLDVEDGDRLMLWDLSRVRAGLAKVGLDWDAPSYPPLPPNADSPTEVQIELGELAVPDR